MMQCWWMHFPLCPWGWRQGIAPATALHISSTWRGNPPFIIVAIAGAVAIAIAIAVTIAVTVSIAVAVNAAVAYHHCRHHWPLLLQPPPPITAAVSSALPLAIAVTVALAISHCRFRHHQPLQLPSPSAITIAIIIGHCWELLPWHGKNSIQTI